MSDISESRVDALSASIKEFLLDAHSIEDLHYRINRETKETGSPDPNDKRIQPGDTVELTLEATLTMENDQT